MRPSPELEEGLQLQQQHQQQQKQQQQQQPQQQPTRRGVLLAAATAAPAAAALAAVAAAGGLLLPPPPPARASRLGEAVDGAWESLGGGPADLTFPETFLGVWDVRSVLVDAQAPLGEDILSDAALAALLRARREDLNARLDYQVTFFKNARGQVVYDRRANTASLLAAYYNGGGGGPDNQQQQQQQPAMAVASSSPSSSSPSSSSANIDFAGRISWSPDDPNDLRLVMPGGLSARTRVMRRSQARPADDRLETSEFSQQVFESGSSSSSSGISGSSSSFSSASSADDLLDDVDGAGRPRVKASQCFTKFKWRPPAAAAGGPEIVATQVVSDYLTPFEGSQQNFLRAANRPVVLLTYKLAFTRHHDAPGGPGAAHHTS